MKINQLDTTGSWAVDGTPIYTPANGIGVEHTNVAGSSSGRTEDGVMHIDWVRRDVRKVKLVYKAMTGKELDFLVGLMQGREFRFTFRDRGKVQTMTAYTGECNYTYYSAALGDDDLYTDVSINVIEM